MVEAELKRWGNSTGVIVPHELLEELGLQQGDKIDLTITPKKRVNAFGICKGAKPFQEDSDHIF